MQTPVSRWLVVLMKHRKRPLSCPTGLAAFGEFWPGDAAPPAITVVKVADVGPPGALVEIEAVAAVQR
jgi:enamine deaminase RidA (YjgF/YER057c/UK114 family)